MSQPSSPGKPLKLKPRVNGNAVKAKSMAAKHRPPIRIVPAAKKDEAAPQPETPIAKPAFVPAPEAQPTPVDATPPPSPAPSANDDPWDSGNLEPDLKEMQRKALKERDEAIYEWEQNVSEQKEVYLADDPEFAQGWCTDDGADEDDEDF